MSTSRGRLLYDLAEHLALRAGAYSSDSLGAAFCAWLLPSRHFIDNLSQLLQKAAQVNKGQRDYHDVSALGFGASCGILPADGMHALRAGLEWVSLRPAHCPSGGFQSFAHDPVALLGMAVGATVLADQSMRKAVADWMASFIPDVLRDHRVSPWRKTFYHSILYTLEMTTELPSEDPASAAARVALRSRGVLPPPDASSQEAEENQAIDLLARFAEKDAELPECALYLAAYDTILGSQPTFHVSKPTVGAVAELLRRVPESMRRWPFEDQPKTSRSRIAQWHIDNEYHVQSLLYALLRPYIPDLTDEENLASIGQKKPRADLASRSLHLVIEVKFLRRTASFQDMIGEVSEDAGLYLKPGSPYDHIIAFVWDDTRSTEQHGLFIQGATEIRGIEHAIVVARPALMKTSFLDLRPEDKLS